jgi:hypothetical protein
MCVAACAAVLSIGAATASATEFTTFTFAGQGSQDSGYCGNNWANDTYTRVFNVYGENSDGSYRVVEKFTHAHFTTIQGMSPGACNPGTPGGNDGALVSAGVKGSFHGYEVLQVIGGAYSSINASSWDGTGGTAGFIAAAFGNSATYNTPDFYFYYHTSNALACMNTWTNAGTGGSGDIATYCP